jgi:nitrous oxidase accessory protein NosD
MANAQAPTETTVNGTGKYPKDVHAVQRAVDGFDVVTLSGTFNFGQAVFPTTDAGTVFITRPNAVLQGPATIIGGGSPSDPSSVWPVIDVSAPGVTVRDLTLVDAADTGVFVHGSVGPSTTPAGVTIRDNTISAEWAGILVYGYRLRSSDPIKLAGNSVSAGNAGIFLSHTGGLPIEIRGNKLKGQHFAILSAWTGH